MNNVLFLTASSSLSRVFASQWSFFPSFPISHSRNFIPHFPCSLYAAFAHLLFSSFSCSLFFFFCPVAVCDVEKRFASGDLSLRRNEKTRERKSDCLSRGKVVPAESAGWTNTRMPLLRERSFCPRVLRDKRSITRKDGEGKSATRRQSVGKLGYINIFCFRTHLCLHLLALRAVLPFSLATSPTRETRYVLFLPTMCAFASYRVASRVARYLRSPFLFSISPE